MFIIPLVDRSLPRLSASHKIDHLLRDVVEFSHWKHMSVVAKRTQHPSSKTWTNFVVQVRPLKVYGCLAGQEIPCFIGVFALSSLGIIFRETISVRQFIFCLLFSLKFSGLNIYHMLLHSKLCSQPVNLVSYGFNKTTIVFLYSISWVRLCSGNVMGLL
jgi:hypothetical protein